MSVKELIKESGYDLYPQDNNIIEKLELKIENKQVICYISFHPVVDKQQRSLVQSAVTNSLTTEEVEHFKQQFKRLQIILQGN